MDKVISVGSIQVEQPSFQFLILTTFSMSPEWIQHLVLPQFPELHKLSENNRVYLDSQWTHETQCPARYEKSSFWQSKLIGFLKSTRIVKQSDSIIFFRVFLIYLVVCLCACMWFVFLCGCVYTMAHRWWSEDTLPHLIRSCHHMDSSIEDRSLGFLASTFTHKVISQDSISPRTYGTSSMRKILTSHYCNWQGLPHFMCLFFIAVMDRWVEMKPNISNALSKHQNQRCTNLKPLGWGDEKDFQKMRKTSMKNSKIK